MNVDGVKAQVVHCSLVTLFQLWGLDFFLKVCNLRFKIAYFAHPAESCKNFVIHIAVQKLLKPWACLK